MFVWSSETKNLHLKGIQNEAVGLGGLHNNGIDEVFLRNIIREEVWQMCHILFEKNVS